MKEDSNNKPTLKAYTFASPTSQPTSQSLQKSMPFPTHSQTNTADRQTTTERRAAGNSGFAKKRVQWLIEHSTSHQLLWYVDSFVLRNPLLRKAAKRYRAL
jgi:hypothetical protein